MGSLNPSPSYTAGGTNIINPTNQEQIQASQGGVNNSMQSQNQLLQALQAQNGISNQTQVYNQLQNQISGNGPTVAQNQLNQSTAQNTQNQAALMAGQRGAGANTGLMARQAAQNGAVIQQNAAGQAATLRAQEQLGAMQQAGQMSNTQASNQVGQTNSNTQANLQNKGIEYGAQQGVNQSSVAMQSNINSANAGLANTQLQGQQGLTGGLMQGAAAVGAAMLMAKGGRVPQKFADGGSADQSAFVQTNPTGPQSKFGQYMQKKSQDVQQEIRQEKPTTGSGEMQKGAASLVSLLAPSQKNNSSQQIIAGGPMDSGSTQMSGSGISPATGDNSNYQMNAAAGGNVPVKASSSVGDKMKSGGKVPGTLKVNHNDYSNDSVAARLSPGEFVLDLNTLNDSGPLGQMARTLIKHIQAKKGQK